jgi:DNA-binding ferritin-like protein
LRAGRIEEAQPQLVDLIADRARILGPEHPHVIQTRLQWTQCLAAAGSSNAARQEINSILEDARRLLEPGHRHILDAQEQLSHLA